MAVSDLAFSSNPGCVRRVTSDGGTPWQCGAAEEFAVPHRYRYPRPQDVRLYVCAWHARDEPGAEPLNDEDRRVIAGRRARREARLALTRR